MNTKVLILIRFIFQFIPLTKFFKLKNWLLNLAKVSIDSSSRIVSSVKIYGNGKLIIGACSWIGHNSNLFVGEYSKVVIGNNVDIAPNVYIGTGSHKLTPTSNRMAGDGVNKSVFIKDGVWVGAGVIILPGITINEMVMIAAGSVVTKDVEGYSIAAGNPARIIKKWDFEKKKWINLK